MDELESWLVEAIEASYEPNWDVERGEFTWGLGLDEPHPRGQFNAFLAAAEAAGPGRWAGLSAAPIERCPRVVDVDFPAVALRRAEWVGDALHLRLAPRRPDPGRTTTFRVTGVEPRVWDVAAPEGTTVDVTGSGVIVRTPMVEADLTLTPGSY